MEKMNVNGSWELIERPLDDGPDRFADIASLPSDLSAQVPGDVNDALVASGRMPEPLVGTNFQQFDWIEDRSWWYRRTFSVNRELRDMQRLVLSLDGLDVHADVWLNGNHLGHQASAFYPLQSDVTEIVDRDGENTIVVRLTTGLEHVPEDPDFPLVNAVPTEEGRGYPERGNKRRIYLRKPAFVWGWDWAPHLPTCGITGNVELVGQKMLDVSNTHLRTEAAAHGAAVIHAEVELEYDTLVDTARADVDVVATDETGGENRTVEKDVFVRSGVTYVKTQIAVSNPKWWWPNGSGSQHLYQVQVRVSCNGETVETEPVAFGLRTVEMDTAPGRFRFVVNGEPVFMKGGNWIPSDSLYGRITPEKLTTLVREAAEAGFNVLRIWGGGRFEMDAFYEACDRYGIMVWHDFMSACAPLPAHEPWFTQEFEKEAMFQVRRLRNRACLLLWCGNNEVGGCYFWFKDQFQERDPAWELYHRILPRLMQSQCPQIPYWPTSPYGGVGTVGAPDVGDDHHWVVMRPESEFWSSPEYWDGKEIPIFNSEYGYGGPCSLESTRQYMGTDDPDLFSETGRQHTNSFYDIPRVNFSIKEHYVDTDNLSLEEFILYGGLCQGLNLGYSLESLRANEQSWGGIFWMYNDAWGENGWTIIDYYLRRKVSYYNVKRCLSPTRLVLRRGGQAFGGKADEIVLVAVNDTAEHLEGTCQLGYVSYDGTRQSLEAIDYSIKPRSRQVIAAVPCPGANELETGTVVAVPGPDGPFEPATWRHCRYREAGLPAANVVVESVAQAGNDLHITVSSDQFAHAVQLEVPADIRLSDNYFDLLPGQKKSVLLYNAAHLKDKISVRCVNGK